jgi:hypothetical protein
MATPRVPATTSIPATSITRVRRVARALGPANQAPTAQPIRLIAAEKSDRCGTEGRASP